MPGWSPLETARPPFSVHTGSQRRLQSVQAQTSQGLPGGACHCLLTCKQVYKSTTEPEGKSGATNCSARFRVYCGRLYCRDLRRVVSLGSIRLLSCERRWLSCVSKSLDIRGQSCRSS